MLSVLIATYSLNTFPLVKKLHEQLERQQISFEIICIDDASNSDFNIKNEAINSLTNCTFQSLSKNLGRSKLRNLLGQSANFNWLLFLDGDVLPTSTNFINNYIGETEKNIASVFLGGIAYKNDTDSSQLRWKLGRNGEEQTSEVRNKHPYNYFFTANFLINKKVFRTIQFDENLTKYGYEDLLFAKELERKSITIKHIDNPVFHLGIDDNFTFINKTKQALENLSVLVSSGKIKNEDTKIYKTYYKLKKYGLANALTPFISFFERKAVKKSSLNYYHLFRLGYLHEIFKNTK